MDPDLSTAVEINANCTNIDNLYIYTAELRQLIPNKIYYYQVGTYDFVKEVFKREIMNFKTLSNYDNNNFSFLAYGDTRTQRSIRSKLAKKIIKQFGDNFEFTILSGDIVEFGSKQEEWNEYFFDTEQLNAYKLGFYIEG